MNEAAQGGRCLGIAAILHAPRAPWIRRAAMPERRRRRARPASAVVRGPTAERGLRRKRARKLLSQPWGCTRALLDDDIRNAAGKLLQRLPYLAFA